jgi:hypothetical protein
MSSDRDQAAPLSGEDGWPEIEATAQHSTAKLSQQLIRAPFLFTSISPHSLIQLLFSAIKSPDLLSSSSTSISSFQGSSSWQTKSSLRQTSTLSQPIAFFNMALRGFE